MTIPNPGNSAWSNLRSLYPLYSAVARESVIEMPPCPELEEAIDVPSAESLAEAEKWIESMDQRIHAHQLRQYLQTSGPADEEALMQLLAHHLGKTARTTADRDKVDFLLVQFFSQRAPSDLIDSALDLAAVAKVLAPVLGAIEGGAPDWLAPLDDLLVEANSAKNLNWLLTTRIIERGREIKQSCAGKFFEPAALAAFTRFGFLLRRRFFRLLHEDLNAILDGLRELDTRGVATLDCRKAQFSAEEPVARLRMICQSWKVMFHAEYSSGQPLCILVDLRTAVETALGHDGNQTESKPEERAAAAGAAAAAMGAPMAIVGENTTVNADAPEFDVSSAPATWDGDTGS